MKKILYAKFNKTRNPKFQISTEIVMIDGKKYVEKSALTEEATFHISENQHRYELNKKLYNNIVPLEGIYDNGIIRFPFVTGESMTKLLDIGKDSVEKLCKMVSRYLDEVLSYRDEVLCEFVCTEDFKRIFGEPEDFFGKAVKGADIDVIFDNLINEGGQWYSIDYEWTFDFPVPVDFIKYRILSWYYHREEGFFSGKMTEEEFFQYFNINDNQRKLFGRWEQSFQYYVFGIDYRYVYPAKYTKQIIDFKKLDKQYGNLEKALTDREINLSAKQHELQQTQMTVQSLTEQRNNYAEAYNQTIQSISWKLTKPVRYIGSGVNKVLRKSRTGILIADGLLYFANNGLRSTIRRIKELYGRKNVTMTQQDFELSDEEIAYERSMKFNYEPIISILVPLYNTPEKFLREMIESVVNQTYGKWQLCLADGSDEQHTKVQDICKEYLSQDDRVLYKKLEENRGISDNTNACIELATGDFIALFDHDDLLTQNALYEVVKCLNEKENVDVVYTDEDKLLYYSKNKSCQYVEQHCKSDFNLDLLRTNNYICHFFAVRKKIVDKIGGFRREYDGSQDYDFIFRCVEQARQVEHIAKILYHWRIHANSTAADPHSKMYCYEAGKHAIESHLDRMGVEASVEMTEHLGFYRIKYPVLCEALISIIIPNKDEKDTLEKCIQSIINKTTYSNYEIIIVENNSKTKEIFEYYDTLSQYDKIKVIQYEDEFNYSKINNFAVKQAKGEYVVLLNNDVEIITDNWLEEMLSNCQRPEVGITGVKLLYPDNTVQHAGVIIGLGGIAGHAFVGLDGNHPGYFGRAFVQQNLSAVTAACFMVSKEIYNEVGGLEETLKVAFNDVDFCLKVRKAGYLVVMNPNVRLYHYESKSRGTEDTPEKQERFHSEVQCMAKKWRDILEEGDPYYNQNLTLIRGDFSLKGKDEEVFRYF